MENLDSLIASIVSQSAAAMAHEIANAVRHSIAQQIAGNAAAVRRGPGRPKGSGQAPAPAAPAKIVKRRGGRRTSKQVAADDAKILSYISEHSGLRALEIEKNTGFPKLALTSGLLRLRAANKIKTKGERSAMTYFLA